jgi:hypothetical protein
MNVRWCTSSGGGCSSGRVTSVVSVATHDVPPGHGGLMAGLAQRACEAVVSNLDLVSVCPAVPNLAPSRFGVALVGERTRASIFGVGAVGVGEVGTLSVHIHAMESWMLAMALVSIGLVATRFSMMVFF